MSEHPDVTWALTRDDDPLSLDAAAAVSRAAESPSWGWFTVEGTRLGSTDVSWLAGSGGIDSPEGRDLVDRLAGLPPRSHLVFAHDVAVSLRIAVGTLTARGVPVPTLEPSAAVVGPDGAPLWRDDAPRLPDVRRTGFEPAAVRSFLAPPGARRAVYLDIDRLRGLNRDAVRTLDADERRRRLASALREINVTGDREYLDLLWMGLRPRLDSFADVALLLAYLAPDWAGPDLTEEEALEVGEIAAALVRVPPESGADAVEILDRLGGGRERVPRRRRLVRWVLTGQEMAPALHAVWDHLGSSRAISRIVARSPGLST